MAAAATARAPIPVERTRRRWGDVPDAAVSTTGQEWPRGVVLMLAQPGCSYCHGLGMVILKRRWDVCCCVYREVFRRCLQRERAYQDDPGRQISKCRLYRFRRDGVRYQTWGRPTEEYIADFRLLAERYLTPIQRDVLRLHHLERRPWPECEAKLDVSRGNFYHEVYRIETKLGRAFYETAPYGLYPPGEYKQGSCR